MRRLRVFESISVDGYFTDAHGDMGWAYGAEPDAEFDAWVGANAGSGSDLVLGRKTYDLMAAFWPTAAAAAQMPAVAAGMNAARKHVATRARDFRPAWTNATRLEGDVVAAVRALKETPGADLTVLGSGDVAAQLGRAGLVDEYQFVSIPVALGAGRTVFTDPRPLRRLDARTFPRGRVVVTYAAA